MRNQSGYTLFLVVSMVVVLSFFLLAVLQAYRVRYGGIISRGNHLKAKYMAEAGISKAKELLASGADSSCTEWLDDNSSYTLSISTHGGYFEVVSIGRFIRTYDTLKAILGERMPTSLLPALTLNEIKKDLVVAGKTQITGDVALVQAQVFPSRVSGYTYKQEKTQTGSVIQLEHPDTLYDKPLQKQISEWQKGFSQTEGYTEIIHTSLFFDHKRPFERSRFLKQRTYVEGQLGIGDTTHLDGPMQFIAEQNVTVEGHAALSSVDIFTNSKVIIQDSASLNDVLVYARKGIFFSHHAVGSGQFITQDTLSLKDNSRIIYPAFCYSLPAIENKRLQGGIFLRTTSDCSGTFVVGRRDTANTGAFWPQSQLFLCTTGRVRGIIFNHYLSQLSGVVEGHITTGGLYLLLGSTSYINWLLNTELDRKKLPNTMVVPPLFSRKPELTVMRYLE